MRIRVQYDIVIFAKNKLSCSKTKTFCYDIACNHNESSRLDELELNYLFEIETLAASKNDLKIPFVEHIHECTGEAGYAILTRLWCREGFSESYSVSSAVKVYDKIRYCETQHKLFI